MFLKSIKTCVGNSFNLDMDERGKETGEEWKNRDDLGGVR